MVAVRVGFVVFSPYEPLRSHWGEMPRESMPLMLYMNVDDPSDDDTATGLGKGLSTHAVHDQVVAMTLGVMTGREARAQAQLIRLRVGAEASVPTISLLYCYCFETTISSPWYVSAAA